MGVTWAKVAPMRIDPQVLVDLRKSYPLTRGELALKIGITAEGLRLIEAGETIEPRPATIRKIAEALGVDVDDLRERIAS